MQELPSTAESVTWLIISDAHKHGILSIKWARPVALSTSFHYQDCEQYFPGGITRNESISSEHAGDRRLTLPVPLDSTLQV